MAKKRCMLKGQHTKVFRRKENRISQSIAASRAVKRRMRRLCTGNGACCNKLATTDPKLKAKPVAKIARLDMKLSKLRLTLEFAVKFAE